MGQELKNPGWIRMWGQLFGGNLLAARAEKDQAFDQTIGEENMYDPGGASRHPDIPPNGSMQNYKNPTSRFPVPKMKSYT
jgi:hypothetical protein